MKACAIKVNGMYRDVYKDPVGDSSKKSKRGRLALDGYNGEWQTIRMDDLRTNNRLELVFSNGKIMKHRSFSDIRERSNLPQKVHLMPTDSPGLLADTETLKVWAGQG